MHPDLLLTHIENKTAFPCHSLMVAHDNLTEFFKVNFELSILTYYVMLSLYLYTTYNLMG